MFKTVEQMRRNDAEFARMTQNIIRSIVEYFNSEGLRSAVVGLSGGIDSTMVAALANMAFRHKAMAHTVKLFGLVMPIATNKPSETRGGRKSAAAFCDDAATVDFTWLYRLTALFLSPASFLKTPSRRTHGEKIRLGNIKARIRMMKLYDMAGKHQGLVLSTDNLTEYYLGFWTLHGDVGDFGPIQNVWKTELYQMAIQLRDAFANAGNDPEDPSIAWLQRDFDWRGHTASRFSLMAGALDAAIRATPTDGLGITSSDFDQLGVTDYTAADTALIRILQGNPAEAPHEKAIYSRYAGSAHKRRNPLNIDREIICAGTDALSS